MLAIPYLQRIYYGFSTDLFRIGIATHFLFLLLISRYRYRFLIFATDFLIPIYSYKGALIAILYHNILWYRIVPLNCIKTFISH